MCCRLRVISVNQKRRLLSCHLVENLLGTVFAGPGGRVMNDLLRGQRQVGFSAQLVIPPRQSQMLLNLPIGV